MFHGSTGIHFRERRERFALPFLGQIGRRCAISGGHGISHS